jgi:hypothetical protein
MATTPTIVVGRNNWGIKNGNLLGYYQSDDGFFVKREFTATRGGGTNGTFVGSNGFIQTTASGDLPRIDFYGGSPALLVEPSAQNVVVQSQNWLASGWRDDATANVTTVTATTGTLDPLGTNTANAISPTSGSATHLKVGSDGAIIFTSGTVYTSSAFFKQGTGNAGRYIQIAWPTTRFAANTFANFDLELGTVALVTGSTVTAGIENYGNGWYRCRCTNTCISNGTGNGISVALIETSGATRLPSFAGTVTDVLYGWGAQTETGSVATSYIPTTTGSVTRNADVINLTGATDYIGQTEGTIYAEVDAVNWTNLGRIFIVSDGTTSNAISILFNTSNRFRLIIDTGGGAAQADISSSSLSNGVHKIAVAYANNDIAFFVDGVLVGTDTSTTIPACSQIFLGKIGTSSSTNFMNDRIRAAAIYNKRLPNDQLQALTTL